MYYCSRILPMLFTLFVLMTQGQEIQQQSYKEISRLIDSYSENDERAMVFVKMYIDKAKNDHNLKKQIRGYEEAIYYSKETGRKLSYADSAITSASKLNDQDQIARAYAGKGIIYYYNLRQYKKALKEYLIAFKYSKNSKDGYLKNKIIYHLGMIKSYLGYYKYAAVHFEETADFFEKNAKESLDRNIRFNNESGYYNSIYRLSTCYRNLKLYNKEDSLINIGLEKLHNNSEQVIEFGYFQKGRGVQLLRKGRADEALKHFKVSQDILSSNQDYASLTSVYFYIGKLYRSKGNRAESLKYFNKVDSLVNKFWFITPEIRSTYLYLIDDAKKNRNSERKMYYSEKLLKADSIINADFVMLTDKIYSEYDTDNLIEEKKQMIRGHQVILYSFIGAGLVILFFLIWRFRKREKELNARYQEVLEKLNSSKETISFDVIPPASSDEDNLDLYSSEIIEDIKTNLKIFEDEKNFFSRI